MEILDEAAKIQNVLGQIRKEMKILHSALERLGQRWVWKPGLLLTAH